jgi:hypothetical protein
MYKCHKCSFLGEKGLATRKFRKDSGPSVCRLEKSLFQIGKKDFTRFFHKSLEKLEESLSLALKLTFEYARSTRGGVSSIMKAGPYGFLSAL